MLSFIPTAGRFRGEATAHHPTALVPINDPDDQINVWVPFHFLPGAIGDSQSQKLKCVKDSALAREMVGHHLALADEFYSVELLGITAHVYADTFAHYGFSGVSSRVNRVHFSTLRPVNADPLLLESLPSFFKKYSTQGGFLQNFRTFTSDVASIMGGTLSGALGHGAVATFPDQPYLDWEFAYEMAAISGATNSQRQNVNDYVDGAAALHRMFRDFAKKADIFADSAGGFEFGDIQPVIKSIVGTIGDRDARIVAWKKALKDGRFTHNGGEEVVDYSHDEWRAQTTGLCGLPTPQDATQIPAYRFHFAASLHRQYVLRTLLPKHGIFVI